VIKKLIISSLVAISVIGIIPVAASAKWKQDVYKNRSWVDDKGVVAKDWKEIDGYWYNFGNNGIMKTGWMKDNGSWYYLWSNGTMAYNSWVTNGGFWYYFDASGKMVSDSVVVATREYDFKQPAIIISKELDSASKTDTTTSNNK